MKKKEKNILKLYKLFTRDKNAVQNMLSIIEELKKTGKRPLRFTREVVEAT